MNRPTTRLAALLCAGCATAPVPLAAPSPNALPTLAADEFPGFEQVGFDARRDDPQWRSGDELTFALRLRKGDEVRRWLLRLEVPLGEEMAVLTDNGTEGTVTFWHERAWTYEVTTNGERRERELRSRALLVGVQVADEQGRELTRSTVHLPITFLGRGLLPAVEQALSAAAAPTANAADYDPEPIVTGILSAMALLNVVQEDDELATYFWQVVEKPSVWSVLTSLGVRATLSLSLEQSVPAPQLPVGMPPADRAFLVPLRIDVNDAPALLADVLAVDSRRPYALCGGMVAATARHPSNPDISFELQLLAARCGPEARAKAQVELAEPTED